MMISCGRAAQGTLVVQGALSLRSVPWQLNDAVDCWLYIWDSWDITVPIFDCSYLLHGPCGLFTMDGVLTSKLGLVSALLRLYACGRTH
jgi:hypothetical protein